MDYSEGIEKVKYDIKETLTNMSDGDLMLLYRISMVKYPKQMPVPEICLSPEQIKIFFFLELEESFGSIYRVMNLLQTLSVMKPLLKKLIDSIMAQENRLFKAEELLAKIVSNNVNSAEVLEGESKYDEPRNCK